MWADTQRKLETEVVDHFALAICLHLNGTIISDKRLFKINQVINLHPNSMQSIMSV